MISRKEVEEHDSKASCWVVIDGHAYDVTEYVDKHPGGPWSILRYAGRDATEEYGPIHPAGTIQKSLPSDKHLGPVEEEEIPTAQQVAQDDTDPSNRPAPLSTLQNLDEFEHEAEKVLSRKAWVYYHSAAEDFSSKQANRLDWTRLTFRPRVLRNVARVSMKQKIMGHNSSLPFFIAPAARARLGHDEGEKCLARGAARYDIPYCSSTVSSISHAQLAKCLKEEGPGGAMLFQLYVPIEKQQARSLIAEARRLGFKALVITVDSAVIGRREEDDRYKAEVDHAAGVEIPRTTEVEGEAPVLRGAHSSTLEWDDLTWIRRAWGNQGPVVLKGIQTVEDAVKAAQVGVDGIYLSNHGGRQLSSAPSSLMTLLEIRRFHPEVLRKLDIYMDGGVTRGTDVIKALCLGAKAVGLGRPFLYALSAYGTDGVCKAIELLSDQIETSMRLLGVTSLDQLDEYYLNTTVLERDLPNRVRPTGEMSSKL